MNSAFSEQILADKLSKLNSTQQCIETLSHWCIFHRKNAEQVVQTWEKQFHSSQKEQKISFLYLANDILQNSKRTGTEFVSEFWKVLPTAVKDVTENGDDHGKNVVSRLVDIWEERRVFGSRARGLKDLMLGSDPLPALELNKKRSRSGSVKIVRRDSRSIKTKLSIGGTAEKIVSALHTVLSEHPDEDTDLDKCKAAIRRLEKMEKDVEAACVRVGDPRRASLAEEIQAEESTLKQCIDKIKSVEGNREALVTQLKEALREQESQLESVRTQLQPAKTACNGLKSKRYRTLGAYKIGVAQGQLEQATNMRRCLNNEPTVPPPKPDSNGPSTTSDSKKTAAAIADRLAASTHSQQIMTSVLSTFAAEEAKNTRPKVEKPVPVPETTTSTTFVPVQSMPQTVLVQQTPLQNQPQYNIFATTTPQYIQPPSGMMIGLPYAYSPVPPPPPTPPAPQMMNLVRPVQIPQQMIQQPPPLPPPPMLQQMAQPMAMHQFSMQQPPPPSYRTLQPPNMGFYPHQPQ